jgi:alpha-mannosidase
MYWKLALVQHPMYFLIKEDTQCAERTPPWGAPSIELYIERVRRNLTALRQYPQLKVGYEWSGLELELLAQDAPEVFQEMCSLAQEGRIAFYNGTYSQPHLQTLSSESNYRQFEYGAQVYRELCGQQVRTYAHQEASVHDQVPQLLNAFGIRYGVVPRFSSTLAWLEEGELILFAGQGPRFVHGHEFVAWRGLDGTEIPLYLSMDEPGGDQLEGFLAHQAIAGRLRVPPIIVGIPDLIEVDEEWLAKRREFDLVLLDEALEERWQKYPARAQARFFTNWSYIEGIRAEELSRSNWRAEVSALRAEALNALAFTLLGRPAESSDCVWKTILATQHHDVYCFCAPELRDKSIGWLQEVERDATHMADDAAQAIIAQVRCDEYAGQPAVIFNTVPHAQKELVTLHVTIDDPAVVGPNGEMIPVESTPLGNGSTRLRFVADMTGLGYATYWVHSGGEPTIEDEIKAPLSFENAFYRAKVHPDGTFTSLVVKPSGDELLNPGTVRGNQLAAMDSTGISPKREGPADLKHRKNWEPPKSGPELFWEPTAPSRVRRSPLGAVLITSGRMGARVKADLTVMFYHQLPRIDLSWTFVFDPVCIGTFYDDDSKLRTHWPLSFTGDISHDIAFGVIQSPIERPFFPASWVDISDGKKGLAYFHQGTPKHWVTEDSALVNLLAWGEYTEAIGSRLWRRNWPKAFDQRLRGRHTIHCALYPHSGDWRAANIIGAARSYGVPPMAYLTHKHSGQLPASAEVLTLTDLAIASTAVKVEDSEIICRVYAATEKAVLVDARMHGLQSVGLRSLSGERITHLEPFQIGQLALEPRR